MEKFTQKISENTNYNSPLSKSEFEQYKTFINNLLEEFNKENLVLIETPGRKPVKVYNAYDYEKSQMPGREYSVLGKVNTNKLLIEEIWKKFNIKDFNHLKNFIKKYCKDLFGESGRFFKSKPGKFSVWDIVRFTEKRGEENEEFVSEFIIKLFGPESNPIREVTSSYKDMVEGIDITFKLNGEEKTCQVKPLTSVNFKERGSVIVYSKGVIKNYNTDYVAFVNVKRAYGDKVLFFKNTGGIFDSENQMITYPYSNLINKKYNFDNVNQNP
jgi:hypothetical protein